VLKSSPRFDCLDGAVLTVEFTSTAGHSFFDAYFPDGTNIGYGRQQIDRRNARVVLPVQAQHAGRPDHTGHAGGVRFLTLLFVRGAARPSLIRAGSLRPAP
jgi:hypothetical protein